MRMVTLGFYSVLAIAATAGAAQAKAGQCRDGKGHFTACTAVTTAPAANIAVAGRKGASCRDGRGHFIACSAGAPTPATAAVATQPGRGSRLLRVLRGSTAGGAQSGPQSGVVATTPTPAPAAISRPARAAVAGRAGVVATGPAPAGATAQCKDGSWSMSRTHSGTCSRHGGVAAWR